MFWRDLAERAVKTAAQAALAVWIVPANLSQDWHNVAAVSASAAVLSVLTSLASKGFGGKESASLVKGA